MIAVVVLRARWTPTFAVTVAALAGLTGGVDAAAAGDGSAWVGVTSRVSVSSSGAQANNGSAFAGVSRSGRYVAFSSRASNLVPGDTNNFNDVFVRDRLAGVTRRVSVGPGGRQGNHGSFEATISADGRYVAFSSRASNLVADDTNDAVDVFVRDRATGVTERASLGAGGEQATHDSYETAISADGRHVAFGSYAPNLVPGDTDRHFDVFVRDMVVGETRRVSIGPGGRSNGFSSGPVISADGRYVAFDSSATNLVAGDTSRDFDVFVWDRLDGVVRWVSVGRDGQPASGHSSNPAISADGRYVAFDSGASNLVPEDTSETLDVFVHDLSTGIIRRVSVGPSGEQANNDSFVPAISADGRYVAFSSDASNHVAGDTNGDIDVFVWNRATGDIRRVSVGRGGQQVTRISWDVEISADGRHIAFGSYASNIVAGDTNGRFDIFVRDRFGEPAQLASARRRSD